MIALLLRREFNVHQTLLGLVAVRYCHGFDAKASKTSACAESAHIAAGKGTVQIRVKIHATQFQKLNTQRVVER